MWYFLHENTCSYATGQNCRRWSNKYCSMLHKNNMKRIKRSIFIRFFHKLNIAFQSTLTEGQFEKLHWFIEQVRVWNRLGIEPYRTKLSKCNGRKCKCECNVNVEKWKCRNMEKMENETGSIFYNTDIKLRIKVIMIFQRITETFWR